MIELTGQVTTNTPTPIRDYHTDFLYTDREGVVRCADCNDEPVEFLRRTIRVQWAHVIDEAGSADFYDSEDDARHALEMLGGGLDRIETTTVVPFAL